MDASAERIPSSLQAALKKAAEGLCGNPLVADFTEQLCYFALV